MFSEAHAEPSYPTICRLAHSFVLMRMISRGCLLRTLKHALPPRIPYEDLRNGSRPYLFGGAQRPACRNCHIDTLWANFCQYKNSGPVCYDWDIDGLAREFVARCACHQRSPPAATLRSLGMSGCKALRFPPPCLPVVTALLKGHRTLQTQAMIGDASDLPACNPAVPRALLNTRSLAVLKLSPSGMQCGCGQCGRSGAAAADAL